MRTPTSTFASLAALAMIALGAGACSDSTSPGQDAQLRFIHAAPGKGELELLVDDTPLHDGVGYGDEVSAYGAVPAGDRVLTVRLTGETQAITGTMPTLQSGRQYTAVLMKWAAGDTLTSDAAIASLRRSGWSATSPTSVLPPPDIGIAIFSDTNTAAAEGKTRLRIINAAPSAESVDVYVTSTDGALDLTTAVLTDVKFQKASEYVEVAEGAQRVRFTSTGTQTVVLDLGEVTLPDGGVRTIVLLDDDEGGTPLKAIVGEDRG